MKRISLLLLLLLSVPVIAQEKIVLSTPVFVSAGITEFRVWSLSLLRSHPDRQAEITAVYREIDGSGFVAGGKSLECRYFGSEAEVLIIALNKANLSTISLEKRLIQRCQTDNKLGAGTIAGTPQ